MMNTTLSHSPRLNSIPWAVILVTCGLCIRATAQELAIVEYLDAAGSIDSVRPGEVVVATEGGKNQTFAIQQGEAGISLGAAQALVNFPARVTVGGPLSTEALVPGTPIHFSAQVNRLGRTDGAIAEITVVDEKQNPEEFKVITAPQSGGDYGECEITGKVVSLRRDRLTVSIPENDYVRRDRLVFELADDATISLHSSDYMRVKPGDEVVSLRAAKFSTGDVVIRELEIQIADGEGRSRTAVASKVPEKYRKFSDEPGKPRVLRSTNFILHTDISDRSANILLDKLETMIDLVSQYYGRRPARVIECFVVRDLKQWPPDTFPDYAAQKIAEPAGVTITRSLGNDIRSIVYACDEHGVAQHEAVHAYCNQTFGDTGPTWYSEGMAEVGNYWKQGQLAVDVEPGAIMYLRNTPPKHLLDIVAAGQITGDSWQAYTWRWALCHLLAFNPNYSDRFKGLGLAMMAKKRGASFESVYGSVAKQVSFEYDQFIQQVDNGYRADLCAWEWNRKFVPLQGDRRVKCDVDANRGWQASGLRVSANESYEYVAQGTWKISESTEVDAGGTGDGSGKLLGAVMQDFELSEPFELGTRGTFTAPTDGDLYLRCGDKWHQLADNEGAIPVHFRRSQEK